MLLRLEKSKEDGYHWFGVSTTVQAYADDVIIFSDTEEGMKNLISIIEDFCSYAGRMMINCKKCHSFTYIYHNNSRVVMNDNFSIAGGTVENVSILGNCTYLGLPIACKASQRKFHVFGRIEVMRKNILRITSSKLRFTQAVDAIKRFVLPMIDYELMSNIAPTNALMKLDECIRGKLSKMLGATGIPTEWFYTARLNGGLQIQKLTDRQKALTIRQYVTMALSKDKSIRKMIKASDDAEITFRDATVDETSPFLNIKLKDNGAIAARLNHGTSNLLARCLKSLHDLKIGLHLNDDAFTLVDLNKDASSSEVNSSNILKSIMKILNNRHYETLCQFGLRGHTFHTLKNSPLSNFFLKPNTLMADSVVKFSIKARTNSLMTNSLAARINQNVNNKCPRCGETETLNHILNGCKRRKHLYTKRHDSVQNILRDYLSKVNRLNVHSNQTIRGRSSERLDGDCASLKPDLWWWEGNHLFIAEFTIPYGQMSYIDGEQQSTLMIRRREKSDKYKSLVEECKKQLNCEATLLVYIVSSLGALPAETLEDLKKVTKSVKDAGKLAGRMVAAALRESMILYYGLKCKKKINNNSIDEDDDTAHSNVSITDDNDIDYDSSDPIDVPIDPEDDEIHSMNSMDDGYWEELINDNNTHRNSIDGNDHNNLSDSRASNLDEDADADTDTETDVLENPGTEPLWSQGSVAVSALSDANKDVEEVQHFTSTDDTQAGSLDE